MNIKQLSETARNIQEWNGSCTYLEMYSEFERLHNNWEYKQTTDSLDSAMLIDCELDSKDKLKCFLNGLYDHVREYVLGYLSSESYDLPEDEVLRELIVRTVTSAYDKELESHGYIKLYTRSVKKQTRL